MKTIYRLLFAIALAMTAVQVEAQSGYWTIDKYAYQYDMTLYFGICDDGGAALAIDDYEIAAFVGDECRGIAAVQTAGDVRYGYMRVRSNGLSGETVTFRAMHKVSGKEWQVLSEGVAFEANTAIGLPSELMTISLKAYPIGDANGDGLVDVADVLAVYAFILGHQSTSFIETVADANGDGEINVADVQAIYSILLKQ